MPARPFATRPEATLLMVAAAPVSTPEMEIAIYDLFRDFFDRAEKRRRWSLGQDIPWDKCNKNFNPGIADIVESFCAVELFLPDYVGKILPMIRGQRGRAWFAANWGYEEAKHSMALGDWLLKSGARTEYQLRDVEQMAIRNEWMLPMDDVRGMCLYSMTQELATWLHYRNLRKVVPETDDPALHTLLGFVAVDERAHFDFFARAAVLHLEHDRAGTIEQLKRVFQGFLMPAVHMFPDGAERVARVKALGIFSDEAFVQDVYLPILDRLGIQRQEMRTRLPKKSHKIGAAV